MSILASLFDFQNPYAQAAQEKYDTWVCQNGTAAQKVNVGTKNGSRVTCSDISPDDLDAAIRAQENQVNQNAAAMQTARDAYEAAKHNPYSRSMIMSPGVAPPLNVPSRADQKKNTFSKAFNPTNRKIIILLIAGFLLFLAVTNAE